MQNFEKKTFDLVSAEGDLDFGQLSKKIKLQIKYMKIKILTIQGFYHYQLCYTTPGSSFPLSSTPRHEAPGVPPLRSTTQWAELTAPCLSRRAMPISLGDTYYISYNALHLKQFNLKIRTFISWWKKCSCMPHLVCLPLQQQPQRLPTAGHNPGKCS